MIAVIEWCQDTLSLKESTLIMGCLKDSDKSHLQLSRLEVGSCQNRPIKLS